MTTRQTPVLCDRSPARYDMEAVLRQAPGTPCFWRRRARRGRVARLLREAGVRLRLSRLKVANRRRYALVVQVEDPMR